jgi:uncharacterized protein YdaU (DUF1376 family)
MPNSAPWFKFYPADFLASTTVLTPHQRGVYITLLCLLYDSDGEIKMSRATLAHYCRTDTRSLNKTIKLLVELDKLQIDDRGIIRNKTVNSQIILREKTRAGRSSAAKSRWKKSTKSTEGGMQLHSKSNADSMQYQRLDTRYLYRSEKEKRLQRLKAFLISEWWDWGWPDRPESVEAAAEEVEKMEKTCD